MSYYEDVSLILSKHGWNRFVEIASTNNELYLSSSERDALVEIITYCNGGDHFTNSDGDHLIVFGLVKLSLLGYQVLFDKILGSSRSIKGAISADEFLYYSIGEDGTEAVLGNYNNSFELNVVRSLEFSHADMKKFNINFVKTEQKQSLPTNVIVDDYTCACGNTKCSTKEKSCWKCGALINP